MFKSLKNTIQSLEKNEISIKELSQEYIKNIKEKSSLNIFIHFDEQKILNQAEILEKDKSELMQIRNFGQKSMDELFDKLKELNLLPEENAENTESSDEENTEE